MGVYIAFTYRLRFAETSIRVNVKQLPVPYNVWRSGIPFYVKETCVSVLAGD
jgi:hypothetical protein